MPNEAPDPKPEDDAPVVETESSDTPDLQAEADKWKALSRKHEAQAKSNAEAAVKLAEMEDADKTELQKALDKRAEAEKRAGAAEAQVLRLEVAQDKGLTPAQSRRLVGSTKEELEADADDLLDSFKPDDEDADKPKPNASKPSEKLKSGTDPEDDEAIDAKGIADGILVSQI